MSEFRVRVTYDYDAQQVDELTIRVGEVVENVERVESGWFIGTLHGRRALFPDNFVEVLTSDANLNQSELNENKMGAPRYCIALYDYEPEAADELALVPGDMLEVSCEVEDGWWRGKLKQKASTVGVFPSNFVKEVSEKEMREELKLRGLDINDFMKSSSTASAVVPKMDANKNPSKAERSPARSSSNGVPSLDMFSSKQKTKPATSSSPPPPALPPKPVKEKCEVVYSYTAVNDDELSLEVGDVVTVISKDLEDSGWWRGELNNRIGVFPDNFVRLLPMLDAISTTPTPTLPTQGTTVATGSSSSSLEKVTSGESPKKKQPAPPPPFSAAPVTTKNDAEVDGQKNELELESKGKKLKHLTTARPRGPANRRPPSTLLPTSTTFGEAEQTVAKSELPSPKSVEPVPAATPTTNGSSPPTPTSEDGLRKAKSTKPSPPPWLSELRGAQNNRNSRLFTGLLANAGGGAGDDDDDGATVLPPATPVASALPPPAVDVVPEATTPPATVTKSSSFKPIVPSKPKVADAPVLGAGEGSRIEEQISIAAASVAVAPSAPAALPVVSSIASAPEVVTEEVDVEPVGEPFLLIDMKKEVEELNAKSPTPTAALEKRLAVLEEDLSWEKRRRGEMEKIIGKLLVRIETLERAAALAATPSTAI
ncbi:unnamed protein product [Notodromas monacha]|uniref:SH3 domain-containing protein n=1 Tax=Notodromas monacha TaxID=399045 RepID=A0A7R9GCL9_9CRUS|nr:unnamed protein product [Notodromas monacha]CAG0916244.1 unnamed protein product [Notodromas monacha]